MNFFHNIQDYFGLSKPRKTPPDPQEDQQVYNDENESRKFFNERSDGFGNSSFDEPSREFSPRGFSVFSDPLQMHRYFEHQMNEILKSFGFQSFDDGNSFFHSFGMPPLEGPNEEEPQAQSGELRDQYLKPGYEHPSRNGREDKDVDGKLKVGDLDSIFGGSDTQVAPRQNKQNQASTRFFGQYVTTKTIRRPDGSVETHRTVKDNEGNEETVITRKMGDKEYTVTKRRNKNGEEEHIENTVNMDLEEIGEMLKAPKDHENPQETEKKTPSWFPFDMFFR